MEKLFSPVRIGNLELKNRFIMAPMENGMAEPGTGNVTERLLCFFRERAKNGVSMIMPGSIGVSPEGRGLPTQLSLWEERHVAEHKRLVGAIHEEGCLAGAQIYHAGRQASEAITGLDPLAPTAMPCAILSNHPKEITTEQMEEIREKFVRSARYAVEAGYDLVEVHFAHGYLLHSFLSTHTNHRTDAYGGSFENRVKYPMEVLEAVIREVGGEVPVQIRVSVDEYVEDGMHSDEVEKVCLMAVEAGVSAVSLSAGCYDAVEYAIQPMYIPQGFILPFAERLKAKVSVPVIVAARLNSAQLIEEAVECGRADIVAIGRGLIADPQLIRKIERHDYENIRYCIACNQGCIDRVLGGLPAHCMVNPVAGEEGSRALRPKTDDKTIAVIGGGPAGMQAALTAAERGYRVNLYAKDGLGGKMKMVSAPPEKETFQIFLDYLTAQIEKSGIRVIEKEVRSCDDIECDEVILATGSSQIIPPIPGTDKEHVVCAEEILSGKAEPKGTAVVIGGGLVGTETCKYLGERGVKLTLVEKKKSIADDIGATYVGHMFAKLGEYGVKVITGATIKEITDDGVALQDQTIACDTVVIAAGYRSERHLKEILEAEYPVHVAGDALEPGKILDATEQAYLAANRL